MQQSSSAKYGQTFWVVAVPRKYGKVDDLYKTTGTYLNSRPTVLSHPPTFRNGTMDELYGLSDDLGRMDQFLEVVVSKIVKQLKDLASESGRDDKKFTLVVDGVNLATFMKDFDWDTSKYRLQSTLRDISEGITQEVTQTDEELRDFQAKFTAVTHGIEVAERNKSGSLQVRDLSNVIKAKHIIQSEHLTTLFVVINKHSEKEWDSSYETLTENSVVPRSSNTIATDNENILKSVVIFTRGDEKKQTEETSAPTKGAAKKQTDVDEFKAAAVKRKFLVREFTYNPEAADEESEKVSDQKDEKAKIQGELIKWCKESFSGTFKSWVHLKVIRLFVESVLRFGLPREYTFILLEPDMKKGEKKLRSELQAKYGHLGSEHMMGGDAGADIAMAGATEEFYPYVYTAIEL